MLTLWEWCGANTCVCVCEGEKTWSRFKLLLWDHECVFGRKLSWVCLRDMGCVREIVLFCELADKAQQAGKSMSVPVSDEQRALFLCRLSMWRESSGKCLYERMSDTFIHSFIQPQKGFPSVKWSFIEMNWIDFGSHVFTALYKVNTECINQIRLYVTVA